MKTGSIVLVASSVLAAFFLTSSEAVTCTADATVTGCTDCTNSINILDPECAAEAAKSSPSPNYDFTTAQPPSAQWEQYRFPWHKVKNMLLMF